MHHIWGHGVAKNGNPTRCYFDQVTCSSVVSSIMHVPCLSTVAPQELFVKCVGSCWQRLGALTTEPRSLGVRISTCHRHPQKLVYYARKAHQAALVSTSMNAVSTATKTQGKPNHWLSQLETKHNKATKQCIVRFLECTLWDTSWHVQKILEKVVRKETGTLLQAANARLTKPAHAEVRFREWQLQAAL